MQISFCPFCQTNTVDVRQWDFSETSVEVPLCGECQTTHGAASVTMKVSAVMNLGVPDVHYRHRDGFVTLASAK